MLDTRTMAADQQWVTPTVSLMRSVAIIQDDYTHHEIFIIIYYFLLSYIIRLHLATSKICS